MLYTDQSIRFAASEIAVYRAMGVDIGQIKTYRQFTQMVSSGALPDVAHVKKKANTHLHIDRASRMQRQPTQGKHDMAKRFGRRAMNGTTEYYDTHEGLRVAQHRENARIRTACFGFIGLIAGGVFAYVLLQWVHVDSRVVRFAGVIVGVWFGGTLAASLSALLWKILKWMFGLTVIVIIGFFIWFWCELIKRKAVPALIQNMTTSDSEQMIVTALLISRIAALSDA